MTGLDLSHIKRLLVRPALEAIGLDTEAAVNLVTGVGNRESGYRTRRQYAGGPARGYWQMEPFTERDIWNNFLSYRASLKRLVENACDVSGPSTVALETNDKYGAAMCRIKFYRSPDPIPNANCALSLARYWKRIYNSSLGSGAVDDETISLFQDAIDA